MGWTLLRLKSSNQVTLTTPTRRPTTNPRSRAPALYNSIDFSPDGSLTEVKGEEETEDSNQAWRGLDEHSQSGIKETTATVAVYVYLLVVFLVLAHRKRTFCCSIANEQVFCTAINNL